MKQGKEKAYSISLAQKKCERFIQISFRKVFVWQQLNIDSIILKMRGKYQYALVCEQKDALMLTT